MSTDHALPRDLARTYEATPQHLNALRDRLAAAAESEGILNVAYRTIDTSVGALLLAATEVGVVRVAYGRTL